MDENWLVASGLTGMAEPAWGHWADQDLGALRRQSMWVAGEEEVHHAQRQGQGQGAGREQAEEGA